MSVATAARSGPTLQASAPVPARDPAPQRPAWWRRRGAREFFAIAIVYALYDGSRFFVEGRQATALAHGLRILHLERALDVDPEQILNKIVSAHAVLSVPADYVYATLHYIVTPVVLVWMWRRHQAAYSKARTILVVATILGLVGFTLLPVAPPRMLPGFVDTMARYSFAGWWAGDASAPRGVGSLTNQYAAMPSLHVGWALWCGWQVWTHARRRWVRVAGVAYPALVTVVVVATANHYFLDAVAGAVVIAVAAAAVTAVERRRPRRVIDLTSVERLRPRTPIP